jgi:Fatty acid desaturase
MWQHQHTYAHHSFTNNVHHDPDLHHFTALLRVHRHFANKHMYKNQANWLYVVFAFTFVTFGTCLWIPQYMIQYGTLYDIVEYTDRKRKWRSLGMILHLVVYSCLIVIVPMCAYATWWKGLTAVWLHVATSGLVFAFFSQINHINEASFAGDSQSMADHMLQAAEVCTDKVCNASGQYNQRHDNSKRDCATTAESGDTKTINDMHNNADKNSRPLYITESWAVQQIESSNNFCPNSRLWHILSNGLNLQIEHHLFPGLNHCHLHLVQDVVQSTCAEYGVKYRSYQSWSEIMGATLQWLDKLSRED